MSVMPLGSLHTFLSIKLKKLILKGHSHNFFYQNDYFFKNNTTTVGVQNKSIKFTQHKNSIEIIISTINFDGCKIWDQKRSGTRVNMGQDLSVGANLS